MLTNLLTSQLNDQGVTVNNIFIDDLPSANNRQVLSMIISKEINRVPTARITFSDGNVAEKDFKLSSGDEFIPGKQIELKAGSTIAQTTLFKGVIVKQNIKFRSNGKSVLIVECKDLVFGMTLQRKNKSFENQKDSDVFERTLENYNLEYELDDTQTIHEKLIQYNSTDWNFLLRRAEVSGLIVIVDDGNIQIIPPSLDNEYETPFTLGRNILDFDGEMDARYQTQQVIGKTWDAANQTVQESIAGNEIPNVGGSPNAEELADSIGNTQTQLHHGGNRTPEELQQWTDAYQTKIRLAKTRGRVRSPGIHPVKPGQSIVLEGMGERFNGSSFVSGVRWEFHQGSWTTDIQFGLDPDWIADKQESANYSVPGLIPQIQGLHTGVVTQLQEDPLGEDRIKIRFPLIHTEDEGVWARMAALDAGMNRGAFFRPEIGDEVITGFVQNDPRDAVILGMLNSSAKPAPFKAKDENHEKGFVTRSGIKLLFNDSDEDRSITILTPGGREVKLNDKSKVLSLKDKNGNNISLSGKGISITSKHNITIESKKNISLKGIDIEQKAKGQFKAAGNGGAEVSTSGVAVLQGSLVQIN